LDATQKGGNGALGSATPQTPEKDGKTDMTTIQDRLNERLNQHDWNPNPGEQLIGEIIEISQRDTKYGAYPLLLVRDDKDGVVQVVHCLRSGLLWPVVRARPSAGDRVGIRYLGLADDGATHSYVVVFENATEAAPDWDRIATTQRERSNDKPAETGNLDAAWPSA
jgi:hypothetical protein